jgi:peptidoglycan/xylan/chitin deacetylase (PgdA/CDA1 family)
MLAAGGAACAAIGALAYATIAPTCQFWGPVVSRGQSSGLARYALTFDDGPTKGPTDAILDILGELGVKGAFFVIGLNATTQPDIVRRMYVEGHVVANHSYDHSHFGVMRAGRYWDRQISRTDRLIEEIIGRRPALFRPPMGVKHGHMCSAARRHGHTIVTWSRRGRDGVNTTPERILNRLVAHSEDGDILLMHDGIEPHMRRDPAASVAAVRPLILALRERGLEPAPLGDLIGVEPYGRILRADDEVDGAYRNSENNRAKDQAH